MTRAAWQELKTLPRAVWWLAGSTLVNRMGAMVFPFLVLYLHRSVGLNLQTSGAIAGCFGVGSALAAPLGGWASDRFDCARGLTLAIFSAGSLLVLYPALHAPIPLAAATVLLGLCTDLSRPFTLTSLARLGGANHSRNAFTLNYLAINLGMSVGPTLGGYLAVLDYRLLFWVDGGSSLLAALFLSCSGARCPPLGAEHAASDWRIGGAAWKMLACHLIMMFVFLGFWTASPLYCVVVLHLSESRVGWIWLLNTSVIVFTSVQLNFWSRGKPLGQLLTASALCMAACYASLFLFPGLLGVTVGILFLTVGEMTLFSNATTYLQKAVPEHKIGRAMACMSICASAALAVSAPFVGYFFSTRNPRELWVILTTLGLLAAWGYSRMPPVAEEAS